jgi:hypothetical protein
MRFSLLQIIACMMFINPIVALLIHTGEPGEPGPAGAAIGFTIYFLLLFWSIWAVRRAFARWRWHRRASPK